MPLHLIKLSVGPDTLSDLAAWQKQRLKSHRELIHITRHTPKRADEILPNGSIYWIIKGWLCARQKLLEFRPITYNNMPHCGLVYDKELIRVVPRPHRPFQGWRYFNAKDAPADLAAGAQELPEAMQRELAGLGLL